MCGRWSSYDQKAALIRDLSRRRQTTPRRVLRTPSTRGTPHNNRRRLGQICRTEILLARRTAALVRAARVLHQHRPRPRRAPRADVGGGVADRPRAFEIDVVLGRGCLQHPRERLAARTRARELWHLALRVVEAVAPVVERDALLGKQLDDPVVDLPQ